MMKNRINFLLILAVAVFISLGCSMITSRFEKASTDNNSAPSTGSSNSNKSVVDQTAEDIADGETTGIQECDDVIKIFSDQSKSNDDNWATKATKDYIFGQIKKSFRESLEQNKNDKDKMAEQCRDYKKKLEARLKEDQDQKK